MLSPTAAVRRRPSSAMAAAALGSDSNVIGPTSLRGMFKAKCKTFGIPAHPEVCRRLYDGERDRKTELDLSGVRMRVDVFLCLIDVAMVAPGVNSLKLRDCGLTDDMIDGLVHSAARFHSITILDVSDNPDITDTGGRALLNHIQRHVDFRELDVSRTGISAPVFAALQRALGNNRTKLGKLLADNTVSLTDRQPSLLVSGGVTPRQRPVVPSLSLARPDDDASASQMLLEGSLRADSTFQQFVSVDGTGLPLSPREAAHSRNRRPSQQQPPPRELEDDGLVASPTASPRADPVPSARRRDPLVSRPQSPASSRLMRRAGRADTISELPAADATALSPDEGRFQAREKGDAALVELVSATVQFLVTAVHALLWTHPLRSAISFALSLAVLGLPFVGNDDWLLDAVLATSLYMMNTRVRRLADDSDVETRAPTVTWRTRVPAVMWLFGVARRLRGGAEAPPSSDAEAVDPQALRAALEVVDAINERRRQAWAHRRFLGAALLLAYVVGLSFSVRWVALGVVIVGFLFVPAVSAATWTAQRLAIHRADGSLLLPSARAATVTPPPAFAPFSFSVTIDRMRQSVNGGSINLRALTEGTPLLGPDRYNNDVRAFIHVKYGAKVWLSGTASPPFLWPGEVSRPFDAMAPGWKAVFTVYDDSADLAAPMLEGWIIIDECVPFDTPIAVPLRPANRQASLVRSILEEVEASHERRHALLGRSTARPTGEGVGGGDAAASASSLSAALLGQYGCLEVRLRKYAASDPLGSVLNARIAGDGAAAAEAEAAPAVADASFGGFVAFPSDGGLRREDSQQSRFAAGGGRSSVVAASTFTPRQLLNSATPEASPSPSGAVVFQSGRQLRVG